MDTYFNSWGFSIRNIWGMVNSLENKSINPLNSNLGVVGIRNIINFNDVSEKKKMKNDKNKELEKKALGKPLKKPSLKESGLTALFIMGVTLLSGGILKK